MVSNLVDQDVAHDMGKVLPRLQPLIQDGTAVQEDHVDVGGRLGGRFSGRGHAAVHPEKIDGLSRPSSRSVSASGKSSTWMTTPAAWRRSSDGDRSEGLARTVLELAEARGHGQSAGHGPSLARLDRTAKPTHARRTSG